ncbi:hypothetical protein [Isoptericola nanjingensis]|uniref:hypothetical protein n=1 Tax=Isoptericola TaxID=254250 RepID=UPI00378BFB02|nr:hypothetical protein [Isoptericola sp. QY 916]
MSSSTPDQDTPAPDGTAPDATPPAGEAPAETVESAAGTDATPDGASDDAADEASDKVEAPQDVTLLVDPERVRRAPKFPVFLWMGALVGGVVGLIFSTWLIDAADPEVAAALLKPGVYVSVMILGGIALGLGVGGLVAVISDRRSLRRR